MSDASSVPSRQPSSDSEVKDSDIGGPDPEVEADKQQPFVLDKSGIARIFTDAVKYGEALDEECEGDDRLAAKKAVDDDAQSIRHFADLVGRDLSEPDLAVTDRYAKISANPWLQEGDGLMGPTSEPEEMEEEEEETLEDFADVKPAEKPTLKEPPFIDNVRYPYRQESISKLSPEQIINLLIEEFGPLTTSDEDEERLLAEMDGAYFQEVAILGIIHLTTHRLTFHASLLSTRPDLLPEQQVIKKGTVTIHKSGFRRKRRVWLELSHDMLTSYHSASDEDHIKPINSILLSSITEVAPEDPRKPRIIQVNFGDENGNYAEFDTEEAARDWRRELNGALYMYRHSRAAYLYRQSEDERNGVRINIPLSRVKTFSFPNFRPYVALLCIEVSSSALSLKSRDSDSSDDDDVKSMATRLSEDEETDMDGRTIQIGAPLQNSAWEEFGSLVEKAQERERKASKRVSPKVIVDFGALSYVEQRREVPKSGDAKEAGIRAALSLGLTGELWYTRGQITRGICCSGYFFISSLYVGCWMKCLASADTKYRFSASQVVGARPNYRYRPRTFGMVLDLRQRSSMYFDFPSQAVRDEAIRRITEFVDRSRTNLASGMTSPASAIAKSPAGSHVSQVASDATSAADVSLGSVLSATEVLSPLGLTIDRAKHRSMPREAMPCLPKVINIPADLMPRFPSQHFVCLTIGSRGDVQPYIALALGLKKEGHTVTIATHAEYKDWIEGWGVRHRTAGGDPGALMKLSVEHKMFSPQFFKESLKNFRSWLDDLLVDAWEQCKDADVLLESPSAMAGVHIAEALNIPYFRTFTMPWTKTTQFPHPFLSPPVEMPSFNSSSFILFDNIFWSATSGQINRWRRNTLHLENTDMGHLAQSKIPFIYNFSPSVVPKPMDWGDATRISGYWFLDNPDLGWTAPESLTLWMAKAREDQKHIVYIGFGSITVPNPPAMTRSIIKAVLKSDVRAVIAKGWSSRMSKPDEPETEFPPECYAIDKVPHDWLFPQIDAAVHHGGAGTTGASLRAGIPTLIKPWFGDQFFWASRVHKLGAGLKISSLNSSDLANALIKATTDRVMKERAASIGEKIRAENGVQDAIRAIQTYQSRAGRDRTEL